MRTEEGRLYLFVAIDRTSQCRSKFAFAELHDRATRRIAADFLRALAAAVPYTIHTVLTDNGFQFVDTLPLSKADAARAPDDEPVLWRVHAFEKACDEIQVEHRLTKSAHPWTNDQVAERRPERMNRTIKDATVHRYYYDTHDQLRTHLALLLGAYNCARRLKALRGLTPYEFVCKSWLEQPRRFTRDPTHDTLGPNISSNPATGGPNAEHIVARSASARHAR